MAARWPCAAAAEGTPPINFRTIGVFTMKSATPTLNFQIWIKRNLDPRTNSLVGSSRDARTLVTLTPGAAPQWSTIDESSLDRCAELIRNAGYASMGCIHAESITEMSANLQALAVKTMFTRDSILNISPLCASQEVMPLNVSAAHEN